MDSLQKVISDYCEDPSFDTGLLLLDLPTGYGKTTAVFNYLANASTDPANSKKHYFFITSMKKNLKLDDLEGALKKPAMKKPIGKKSCFLIP